MRWCCSPLPESCDSGYGKNLETHHLGCRFAALDYNFGFRDSNFGFDCDGVASSFCWPVRLAASMDGVFREKTAE